MTLDERIDYEVLVAEARDYAGVDEYGGAVLLREVATAVEALLAERDALRTENARLRAHIDAPWTGDDQ